MASFTIEWQAPEYEYHEKTISWYWASIIVAAVIIAFSIWEKDFLFGFFIIIAEILLIVWGNRAPRTVHFTLTERDITIADGKVHPLKNFESFSIEPAGDGISELVFTFHAKLRTPLKTILPEERTAEVRNNLKTLLKEVPYEPTLIDSIEKLLHF